MVYFIPMSLNKITYCGIGSRTTPENVLEKFVNIAGVLAKNGLVLRSGGAVGADMMFEIGCDLSSGAKEIFLPWKNFNNNKSEKFTICDGALEMAEEFHPAWDRLSDKARLLMARNSYQVMGETLDDPVDFVICWTENGGLVGGTSQALRIAKRYGIPVYNFGINGGLQPDIDEVYHAMDNIKIFL